MRSSGVVAASIAVVFALLGPAVAQDGDPASGELPPVEVIQENAAPAPAPQASSSSQPTVSPTPQAPPAYIPQDAAAAEYFGAPGGRAAAARAESGPASPINPMNGILPGDLSKFPSAGTTVTTQAIDELHPRSTNEIFNSVPGVHVVNDDGFGRHGGIGIRGSPPRRGRKVLVMEDGQPINMGLWHDPSVHYSPPVDRIEAVDVIRGTIANYGPNNNHGVVNYRNFSPFGPNETVISGSIGMTNNDEGSFYDEDDDELFTSIGRRTSSGTWHMHTRQMVGNVGAVFSYSGADVAGTWDTERLRYNDFYGALGWKGVDQDFTVSAVYFRQRDLYDEGNLEAEDDDDISADALFYNQVEHCKTCYNPGSLYNTYNADIVKLQALHNYYLDDTTTITSRTYGFFHRRDRYQNFEGEDPTEEDEFAPTLVGDEVYIPEGVMLGRLRTYKQYGAEVRAEFADRPFVGGMRQDIQTGVRYEYNTFTNRNFFGEQGRVLRDGDTEGLNVFNRYTDAHAFSAFLQSTLHVASDFTVTPGVRLDHYRVRRKTFVLSEEEGEGEEYEECLNDTGFAGFGNEECAVIELDDDFAPYESFSKTHVLPSVALAYSGFYNSTVYGGYHRGLTIGVLREAALPPGDEIGDNFQIGVRSTALTGITFDITAYHQRIQDFQIKGSATDASGNNVYSNIDEVHINGFETYGRIDSHPFTGGSYNFFFEGNYTLADSKVEKGMNEDGDSISGNYVPEVPRHFAMLTVGMQHKSGWDVSASYTYRGGFYTDEDNTFSDFEGEDGFVPDVWLLSARANYRLPDTGLTLFVAGDNLTDELYIQDREDGVKPGQARTLWAGFKLQLQ